MKCGKKLWGEKFLKFLSFHSFFSRIAEMNQNKADIARTREFAITAVESVMTPQRV
jgi:hypothetical protein